MAGARFEPTWADRVCLAILLAGLVLGGTLVYSQTPPELPASADPPLGSGDSEAEPDAPPLFPNDLSSASGSPETRSPEVPADARPVDSGREGAAPASQDQVVQVRVTGNGKIPLEKILPHIRTRAGRPYDPELVEEDVRRLTATRMFVLVRPYSQKTQGGRVVIFEVLERPILHYIKYVGNVKIKKKKLQKEAGIKPGDSLDNFAVEEARRRLEEYYHSHGFPKARITLVEGDKSHDRGAIFLINEGQKQKVLWTDFEGNTIANDARLRTQIQSKPGFLWIFKGDVDRKQIDEDINRLTAYYRSLGFFRARVGRQLHYNEKEDWLSLTFVIDEGPRYKVRDISFIGNTKFSTEELATNLKLKSGQYFNQGEMKADVNMIQDTYGGIGYIFSDIQADPRFLEEPGTLDLVYNIREGERFRVGKINVQVKGDYPHTRITTVLNRMSVRPGDIVDIRELRASERRLRASGLFEMDPQSGQAPKIVFSPPDAEAIAKKPKPAGVFRGQSPDPEVVTVDGPADPARFEPGDRPVDLTLQGTWFGYRDQGPPPPAVQPPAPAAPAPASIPAPPRRPAPTMPLPAARSATETLRTTARPNERYFEEAQAALARALTIGSPVGKPEFPDRRAPFSGFADRFSGDTGPASPMPAAAPPPARPADYPVQNTEYTAPVASPLPERRLPPPNENDPPAYPYQPVANPATPPSAPAGDSGQPPLRGDFRAPAGKEIIIRGQYSSDAGRSIPPLSRRAAQTPFSFTSGTRQPEQTIAPPNSTTPLTTTYPTTTAQPSFSSGTTQPGSSIAAQPYTAGAMQPAAPQQSAPQGPVYGNSVAPAPGGNAASPYAPPMDVYPVAPQTAPGGATINDASSLLGNSPDQEPPPLYIPLDPMVTETRTGRLMFSVGVNSDAGLLGSVIIDEQNFDWTRVPTSWEDIRNGTAFRGAGQRFRAEAVPGTEVQKYLVSFQDPYAFDTNVSLGLSGFFYNRQFREWSEERIGGRVALGYQFAPDLSGSVAFRAADVDIYKPIVPTPQALTDALGHNSLYGFQLGITRDTRDNTFLPTEGSLIELTAEQVIGTFQYPRFEVDLRRYFMLRQRPDGSGRHVLSLGSRFAYTGTNTPIYEHHFAGGFSTIRGFDFRGASPRDPATDVLIGGEFMLLNSAEYMFPITADDMIRGVVFCDTGTVEPTISDWSDRYRVSVGFGLRITIPAMGPAPIALDLAVPVSHEPGDEIENFSFFVGFLR
jgi:outer membrane protein insertion porin family